MDPSLTRFVTGGGLRLDAAVPYDLGEYLQSGTELSPRQLYEEALNSYVAAHHPEVSSLEELKRARSVVEEAFPFVPGTLRGKVLSVAGESVEMADTVFHGAIDYTKVKVFNKKFIFFQPNQRPMSPNGNIYYSPKGTGDRAYMADFSTGTMAAKATFIHELTHVWQHQNGVNVTARGIVQRNYEYLPLDTKKSLEDYGIEQQGSIVEHYFYLINGYSIKGAPPIVDYETVIPFAP